MKLIDMHILTLLKLTSLLAAVLLLAAPAGAGPWAYRVFLHDGKLIAAYPCPYSGFIGPIGTQAPTNPIIVSSEDYWASRYSLAKRYDVTKPTVGAGVRKESWRESESDRCAMEQFWTAMFP
jgi:hypothetical protein